MQTLAPPSFVFITRVAILFALLIALSGAASTDAQDATETAEATGGFIETVGGKTERELPAPIFYDADGSGSLDADELATAVEDRYPKMIWPAAYAVSLDDLLAKIDASAQASWPIGSEFRVLEMPAVCAWFEVFLDAYDGGNTLQQPAALDQAMYVLGGVRSMSAEESLGAIDAIRYATLGDDTLIRAYVDEGPCQDEAWFETGTTPVATPVSRVRAMVR